MLKLIVLLIGFVSIEQVLSHGMVLNPASRSSRWRYNSSAPVNWDDNQLYCGGFGAQWNINGGKCGLCGDDFRNSKPRSNEYGGRYGEGIIVANYPVNGLLPVSIRITANHIGYFMFDLCKMDNSGESEECFSKYPLKLDNGADRYPVRGGILGMFDMTLKLPTDLTCEHCVLRWIYVTGNTWGCCPDGRCSTGCGPQEQFRSCSDISIKNKKLEDYFQKQINELLLNDEIPLDI